MISSTSAYASQRTEQSRLSASFNGFPPSSMSPTPSPGTHVLSEAECRDIANRLARAARGGGATVVTIVSTWLGNVRWGRNRISTSGEDRNDRLIVQRRILGAYNPFLMTNEQTDAALTEAVHRAERFVQLTPEIPEADLNLHYSYEPYPATDFYSTATDSMNSEHRATVARSMVQSAEAASMLSAGYLEVVARSIANITSFGLARYCQYTWARCSLTVRDPNGTGSGWAGVDWPDWSKINSDALSTIALDKCLTSRNPVVVEPGRYTTILEPQAVCDFMPHLLDGLDRQQNEGPNPGGPFWKKPGFSRLGEQVMDERLTIGADPMDPDLRIPPFDSVYLDDESGFDKGEVFHPITWIERGVLTNLSYSQRYAAIELGRATGLPSSGAFRVNVTGPTASIPEMIASTKRGLLVTRFSGVQLMQVSSILCRGYTRDGVWLIENGKISKPVKNLAFTESVVFALNRLEQLGVPQRAFHPTDWADWREALPQPVFVPALKVRDFSFTALADAV